MAIEAAQPLRFESNGAIGEAAELRQCRFMEGLTGQNVSNEAARPSTFQLNTEAAATKSWRRNSGAENDGWLL
jgi:hypothetical protein